MRSSGEVLVLKEFALNEGSDEFLKIVGRASGLKAWVLSKFGIEPETSLSCNKKDIRFEEASIRNGKQALHIPLGAVSAVESGMSKPFRVLVCGAVLAFAGIIGALAGEGAVAALGLILGAAFLASYWLTKTTVFGIYCGGDNPIASISISRSVIEGQNIDASQYEAAAKALLDAVLLSRK